MSRTSSSTTAIDLRHAMGHFATGVTVVTTLDEAGEPVGTTANSVTSLSLDPPLILVCFNHASGTLAALCGHGAFAVNVLGAHHREVATAFARPREQAVWRHVEHHPGPTESPHLRDALATLDCVVEDILPGGDHAIVVGHVVGATVGEDDAEPLLYYCGAYARLIAGERRFADPARAAR
jgi:flavin reductase (DIM6/NTAB) family NADH-FMN oxidoreductase RutF